MGLILLLDYSKLNTIMPKFSNLRTLMSEELPSRTFQKKLSYRTSEEEALALFKVINKEIFGNILPVPEFQVKPRCRKYWGYCIAQSVTLNKDSTKSSCIIKLSDKWYCKQWFILTLAHEMCHQYQWDILGHLRVKEGKKPLMSHGPSFFLYRDKLMKHGIPLKRSHGISPWFSHQNLFKC